MVLDDRVGVERLTAGRDRSAGLMSGILAVAGGGGRSWRFLARSWSVRLTVYRGKQATSRAEKMPTATRQGQSFGHATKA